MVRQPRYAAKCTNALLSFVPHSYQLENSLNYCVHSVCIPRATNSLLLFTVYLHCSYRLENTLNYGMERVWAVGYVKGSNSVAVG